MGILRRPAAATRPWPGRASGARGPSPDREAAASPALIWMALGSVYLIWGSTYLAIRVADRTIPPLLMASVRFLIAGAALYAWAIRRGEREADRPGWREWRAATIVGGLLLLGGNGGVVWAEQHVDSGIVAIIVAMVPIWMALIDRFYFGQRLSGWAVVGLVLGFGGLVLLVGGPSTAHTTTSGIAVVVVATLCWAVGSMYARRAPLPKRPLVGTSMEMLAGGVLLGIAGLLGGEAGHFHPSAFSAQSLWSVAYLIVFGSWIGFVAYVWLLRVAPISLVGTYAYVNPVIAVFLGWALLNEVLAARTLVAAAIIVVGVALIISARKVPPGEPGPAPPDQEALRSTGDGESPGP